MTPDALRAALDAAGYPGAEIRGSIVIVRDRNAALNYRDHREALKTAGIPVLWGGVSIGGDSRRGWYWYCIRLAGREVSP